MGADRREQEADLVRLRPRGVVPLELWDFLVGDRTIWERRNAPEFPEALLEMLLQVRAGRGRTRSRGAAPDACRDFDAVFVGGGASLDPALRDGLRSAPFPVTFSEDGPFVCEAGGRHLLGRLPAPRALEAGMIVDVGQVQIKVTAGARRFVDPRDFTRLPIASEVSPADVPEQRSRLRSFLGSSLRRAIEESGIVPAAIVLALPCEVGDDGLPGGCSYAGTKDNALLVPSALRDARIDGIPGFLVNDAELAAVSASGRSDARGSDRSIRTLVLTLGFGVGAALLTGEP